MQSRLARAYSGTSPSDDKVPDPGGAKAGTPRVPAAQETPPRSLQGLLKLVGEQGDQSDKFTQVATFLMLIGQEEAARILRYLPEDLVERLSGEIAQSRYVPKSEAQSVLQRFERLQEHEDGRIIGGVDTAQAMLVQAFGEEQGKHLLYKAVPEAKPSRFSFLQDLDPRQLRILLKDESIPVIAIVLSAVPARLGSKLLAQYEPELRLQLARRIARAGQVDSAVLERISEKLKESIREHGHTITEEVDGSSRLAAILKHIDLRSEERILGSLQQESPDLSERVREHLFTIDTILDIDDRDLQEVLQEFADMEIALLLKGKEQGIREKIMRNVSSGRQELIASEYTHLGAQLRSEVDAAAKDFIAHLRKLDEEGKIRIHRRDDQWVT
ncbi:flagellar motor switch protein [Spirochaeta africana DSM 8902]|uniref:Flagellar motor switch protein FliG n=2 Tax=Spirochaeta TaxID=146 RepID=H9UGQ8_SPIAZ|nr:flagellar motor switch protein [Spirochaeta africana DSM 8902]